MINFPRIVTNYTFEGEICELISIDFKTNTVVILQEGKNRTIQLDDIEIKLRGYSL